MKSEKQPKLMVYVSTLKPEGIGIAKAILTAAHELENLGFDPTFRQADLSTSILDAGRNAVKEIYAVLFDGIGLGFRYGTLANMISSLFVHPRVFLTWHEDRWVYDRLMSARSRRGWFFNKLITSRRLNHLVISERAKGFCESLGVPGSTIHVIGGCVSPPDETARSIHVFPPDGRVRVVATGSIQARKGTDIFCDAAIAVCKRLSHVDFFWVGRPLGFEPEFYESCVDMVRRSGFEDRIQFCGFVERADVYMAHCDIFVMPSRDEPLGLSALEAMSFAKTVIAFDVGGLAELMAGYFVLLGQPSAEDLAEKLVELATGSADDLVREDARRRVSEIFSPKQYAARIAAAVRSVGTGSVAQS